MAQVHFVKDAEIGTATETGPGVIRWAEGDIVDMSDEQVALFSMWGMVTTEIDPGRAETAPKRARK